ncbi:hypothetical protein HZC31_02490 [Candidatus Woesearchaeota archaeon]|nr:hypothetical protein [Candidatus Woesearchaeota archaeon]
MIDQRRIDDIVRFYNRFSDEERRHRATSIGCYRPTRIDYLKDLFHVLSEEGFLQYGDVFLDAGGGDGRVAALGAAYNMRTYSVEGDRRIHALAEKRIGKLREEGLLPVVNESPYPILAYGDFLDMRTYVQLRLRPSIIDTVFNGGDNELAVARFMRQHTRQGTYMLLMQSDGVAAHSELFHVETYRDGTGRLMGKVFSLH